MVAVTETGRSRQPLTGAEASHAVSARARPRPGTVPTQVTRPAPWARVVTAGQRPKCGWSYVAAALPDGSAGAGAGFAAQPRRFAQIPRTGRVGGVRGEGFDEGGRLRARQPDVAVPAWRSSAGTSPSMRREGCSPAVEGRTPACRASSPAVQARPSRSARQKSARMRSANRPAVSAADEAALEAAANRIGLLVQACAAMAAVA
ncbi:hypothetical protein GCM10010289_01240 [Streptomyces violascens]|nr:hypothetical protein GCM10010289_01240 [Streptomyces violascens]